MEPFTLHQPARPRQFFVPEPALAADDETSTPAAVCFRFVGTRALDRHVCGKNRTANSATSPNGSLPQAGQAGANLGTHPKPCLILIRPSSALVE